MRDVRLFGERHHMQFCAQMYNVMNRVQVGFPGYTSVIDTSVPGYQLQPLLGKINSLNNSPRNMLMMLKYVF